MRLIKLVIFIFICQRLASQVTLGGNYFLDIYKPYTKEAQDYLKINDKVKSHTWNVYLNVKVLQREKISWRSGLTYKHIWHKVDDKIKTYYYTVYGNGVTSFTHLEKVDETLDLKSRSNSYGIMNELSYIVKQNEKVAHELGMLNELYLLEFFKSAYYHDDSEKEFDRLEVTIKPITSKLRSPFLFSSTNLSVFYRIEKQLQDNRTIACKLNVGTNVYSDWDQFRKYAWIGLGVEVGFGDLKIIRDKP
ncbi:MAG: hypothetical protein ACO1O6_12180 [Bacteroidota bacterium]